MENLGFLDIITLITLIIAIYLLFNELYRKHKLGKLSFKVSGDFNGRSSIFFWYFMGFFWTLILIAEVGKINPNYYDIPISSLASPVIWIVLCTINILRIKYAKEIRENGIIIGQDYVHWINIIKYEWIGDERLGITYFKRTLSESKKETSEVWIIEPEDKEKIDIIFNRYMNKQDED